MNIKLIPLVFVLVLLTISQKAKIRTLNEKNLEQFAKDNSYWLIQISSKSSIM